MVNVLTIAGSDSGGGAGIQADIKTISATGNYACSVITALTAQNTCGVQGIHAVPRDFIIQQGDSVFSDLDIKAVKIGMLGDVDTILAVSELLSRYQPEHVVLDPVMVATSGDSLLAEQAVQALVKYLLPMADIVTPNLPEAFKLAELQWDDEAMPDVSAIRELGQQLLAMGCRSVLIKGGHQRSQQSCDYWFSHGDAAELQVCAPRYQTSNTHGTGCTLSASIASYLAQGYSMQDAIHQAKAYITQAIAHADELQVGQGHGPVHHFYALDK